jgi:hypothetical protein
MALYKECPPASYVLLTVFFTSVFPFLPLMFILNFHNNTLITRRPVFGTNRFANRCSSPMCHLSVLTSFALAACLSHFIFPPIVDGGASLSQVTYAHRESQLLRDQQPQ